jgi:hypothetical protein
MNAGLSLKIDEINDKSMQLGNTMRALLDARQQNASPQIIKMLLESVAEDAWLVRALANYTAGELANHLNRHARVA